MAKNSKQKPADAKTAKTRAALRRRTRMIALEPRMLFDGALGIDLTAKATAALQGDSSAAESTTTPATPESQRTDTTDKSAASQKPAEKAAEKPVESLESRPDAID